MDSTGATPSLQVPRLRLSRLGPKHNDEPDTPQAGPSRLSPGSRTPILNGLDDHVGGDDAQSTPRMPIFTSIPSEPNSLSATPVAETPSARLRALLSRVPHSPSTTRVVPVTPSEPDSDFDPPRSSPVNTPSIARESLKDLFSRALRDPGDTPQKSRRRNSIDVSEVDASPRAEHERARNRGQRRSLSDEEADKPSLSLRSSQAATFDILRARLTNSQTQIMNQNAPFDDQREMGLSDIPGDSTADESFLRGLEQAPASPPVATSTPHRSVQMPSQIQFQSNLMEQDSDMRNAIRDLDSFEGASRPVSFPPSRQSQAPQSVPGRPLSQATGSKVNSMGRTPGIRPRVVSMTSIADSDYNSPSRASSSMSHPDIKEKGHDRTKEQAQQREREWNKPHPQPKTPENHHRHSHSHDSHSSGGGGSPMLNLTNRLGRRDSLASLQSTDDGLSSRGSSIGSQAEYRERIKELERDRNVEREREWNKRHIPSRPTSSLSMNSTSPRFERVRTQSQPLRPDSSLRYTPDHTVSGLYRHQSFNSPGSRPSSRSSSVSHGSSKEMELEIQHDVEHTRERNWNSPHPKWDPNDRAVSPSLRASSPRPGPRHSHSLSFRSSRAESPTAHLQGRPSLRSSLSHSSLSIGDKDKAASPGGSTFPKETEISTNGGSPTNSRPRSLSHTKDTGNSPSLGHASPVNRFGWQFPRNKTQLPPIEYDELSPERPSIHSARGPSPSPSPGARHASRASFKASHIPVRSHHTPDVNRILVDANESSSVRGLGYSPSITGPNESNGQVSPPDSVEPVVPPQDKPQDAVLTSDEDPPSPLAVDAATLQAVGSPEQAQEPLIFSPPVSPASRSRSNNESSSLPDQLASSLQPPVLPEFTLSLATPPRPRSANSLHPEFETPPAPEGLPDLPGPPSDDESEADWTPDPRIHLDFSTMKTPKPPGAWNFTPVAPHREPLSRASTLPDSDAFGGGSSSENGLATPLPSLSRASTLPLQTPAPPGAWLNTPGLERRKNIMKVRFDMESELSASDIPNSHFGDSDGPQAESPSDLDLTPTIKPQSIPPSPADIKLEEVPTPVTPRSTPPSSLRRSPVVRVVDAFGREHKGENGEIKQDPAGAPSASISPRSKSSIRIVDAMGREVEEKHDDEIQASSAVSDDEILSHNEALRRVRQSIADLASGLSDVESSSNELDPDVVKMHELNSVSQAARDARQRLTETLRIARDAEIELRSKLGLRQIQLRSDRSWRRNGAFIFWALTLQVVFIFVMYRFSVVKAKDLFLSTYYDPYYPELHLYATKPDTIRLSMDYASRWSISSVPETIRRSGLRAVATDAWRGFALTIYDWQRYLWNTWGTPEPASWPPT